MNYAPLVSVCIPAYNASSTLGETLDSILSQDYPNIEIIVSDNQSTDNTPNIVREYEKRGIKYFLHIGKPDWEPSEMEINHRMIFGAAEINWNYVLSLASGEFIALYHADDLYHTTMVRSQVDFLMSHSETSSVFIMSQNINDMGLQTSLGAKYAIPPELDKQSCFDFPSLFNMALKYHNFISTPTLMTRRETLETVGFFRPELFLSSSDLDLWLRMAMWKPIGIINKKLHYYRVSSNQGVSKISKIRTESADFFKVMDFYLNKPEVRKIVDLENIKSYEVQRILDELYCINNLLLQKKKREAIERFFAIIKKNALIKEGLKGYKLRFTRLFFVTFAHIIGNYFFLDNISAKIYLWLKQYHLKRLDR